MKPGIFVCLCIAAITGAGYMIIREMGSMNADNAEQEARSHGQGAPSSGRSKSYTFSAPGGPELGLDLYSPTKGNGPFPITLTIHGGGWSSGGRAEMAEISEFLADRGWVVASIDYRLSPANPWPAQLEDVRAAVRFVRSKAAEFHIDPHKMASVGVSAGGHLSLFLGATGPDQVQAVGSISGIHDLRIPLTHEGEGYQIVPKLLGNLSEERLHSASPLDFLTEHSAPTYFLHGDKDPLVPANQSTMANARLGKLGVDHHYELVPGMEHGLKTSVEAERAALGRMSDWLMKELAAPHIVQSR